MTRESVLPRPMSPTELGSIRNLTSRAKIPSPVTLRLGAPVLNDKAVEGCGFSCLKGELCQALGPQEWVSRTFCVTVGPMMFVSKSTPQGASCSLNLQRKVIRPFLEAAQHVRSVDEEAGATGSL